MLLRQTFRYLPAQVMSPLIQMATILVWAHLLPAGEVGVLTLVVAIQEISFGFFLHVVDAIHAAPLHRYQKCWPR